MPFGTGTFGSELFGQTGGGVTVIPAAASFALTAVDPTVRLGGVTVAPAAAVVELSAASPTVIIGGVALPPGRPRIMASISFVSPALPPVWEPVTPYLRAASWTRGRSHELDQVQAGSATVTLTNTDRRFDPAATGYVAGPYGANVRPMRRLRLRAEWAGVTYDLFHGYIESFRPDIAPGNGDATMIITAVDGFKVLAGFALGEPAFTADRPQERTDLRMGAVLDALNWPAADRDLGAGLIETQARDLAGESALGHMQQIAEDEKGFLFMSRAGAVTFRHRYTRMIPAAPVLLTLGDGGGAEQLYPDVDFSVDDGRIINDARITRDGGTEQIASDDVSKTRYYTRSHQAGGLHAHDGDAMGAAEYLVGKYWEPLLRTPALLLDGDRDPAVMWPHLLGRELGDRIEVRRRPPGGGAMIAQESHLEGVTVEWAAPGNAWAVTWEVSPGDATDYWLLGDATYSVVGVTTIPSY